jgi:hypothetical protein
MMLPIHLHDAVLAQCTIQALHIFRQWHTKSAERHLQLRFPSLTLAHILHHTPKPLWQQTHVDNYPQTCDHIVRGRGWELYYFIPIPTFFNLHKSKLRLHLRLTREACGIFDVQCQRVRLNINARHLLLLICRQNRYDFVWWDFHDLTRVAVQYVEISRDICKHFSPDMPYFLSPNGRAILIHHTIIHFNGTITPVTIPPHGIVRWSQTHLYANNQIIHTLDDM